MAKQHASKCKAVLPFTQDTQKTPGLAENGFPAANTGKRQRLVGLDLFRIASALVVMLFHSWCHIGCTYGVLEPFISMGAVFMTGFFLLSGFSLFYIHGNDAFSEIGVVKNFLQKRLIGIFPLYYATSILFVLFLGSESPLQNYTLLPIEILGLQSIFSSLFGISHNGGTWFVSCIFICYLVFPFISLCIRQMTPKSKLFLGLLSGFIILYAPFVQHMFQTNSIYEAPPFRILEFLIGCILASEIDHLRKYPFWKCVSSKTTILLETIVLIVGVTLAYKLGIGRGNYMLYSWVCLPIFCLMILGLANTNWKHLSHSKLVPYFSAISYAFFLAQFFVWPIIQKIGITNNLVRILASLVICTAIAIGLHEIIEEPCKSLLTKKFILKKKP